MAFSTLAKGAGAGAAAGSGGGVPGAVIGAGIGAIASIFGAKKQSQATKDASKIGADYNNRALSAAEAQQTWERDQAAAATAEDKRRYDATTARSDEERTYRRGRYADYMTQMEPYAQAGRQGIARASSANASALPASAQALGSGAMVKLADKRGRVISVPASQAEFYIQQGAKAVE